MSKTADGINDQNIKNLELKEPEEAKDNPEAIKKGAEIYWKNDILTYLTRFMLQSKIKHPDHDHYNWRGVNVKSYQIERVNHLMMEFKLLEFKNQRYGEVPPSVENF